MTNNVVDTAMEIALRYHAGQISKHDGEPYILHPMRVYIACREEKLPFRYQAIAWLHDVLEDTEVTAGYLFAAFPDDQEIPAAVIALSKIAGESNEDYYKRVIANGHYAGAVKLRDIYDNFRRNHLITDEEKRLRMAKKYSLGLDMLKDFR